MVAQRASAGVAGILRARNLSGAPAHACVDRRRRLPRAAKDQVIKFALKRKFEVVLVAGQSQVKPAFACVRLVVVPSGPDAADDHLVEQAEPGDLVICSDVPLADRLVKKGIAALDPRGREFDERNMGERLAVRNLFTDLRDQGQMGWPGRLQRQGPPGVLQLAGPAADPPRPGLNALSRRGRCRCRRPPGCRRRRAVPSAPPRPCCPSATAPPWR